MPFYNYKLDTKVLVSQFLRFSSLRIGLIVLFFIVGGVAGAQERHWIGAADNNWNNVLNWSATAGGAGGASVPGSANAVFFDSGYSSNCIINTVVSVASINIASGYSGVISQGSNPITVNGACALEGGTFSGGSADITVKGNFNLSGCSFTSTSATLELQANLAFSGGTFDHNNGKLKLNPIVGFSTDITGAGLSLAALEIVGTGKAINFNHSGSFTVLGDLTTSGTGYFRLNNGTIDAKGDLRINNTSTSCGGTATINISGTAAQTIHGSAASMQSALPKVTINKSSGTLFLTNHVSVTNDFNFTAGALDAGSSTFVFVGFESNYTIRSSSGSLMFNNLRFDNITASWVNITIESGTTLKPEGNFEIAGTQNVVINTGTIEAKKDVILTNTASDGGGTAVLLINGTVDQTISGSGISVYQSKLPTLKINKPSGTLNFEGNVSFNGDFRLISGTLNAGSSTIAAAPEGGCSFEGNVTLYNFNFNPKWNGGLNIASSTNITVLNDFVVAGNFDAALYNGTITVKGDIYNNNKGGNDWGSAKIIINGTDDQAIVCNGIINKAKLPGITINKPSGVLTLPNILNITGAWQYLDGDLDVVSNNSTLVFAANNSITGSHTLNNVTFLGPYNSNYQYTLGSSTELTLLGSLTLDGPGNLNLQNGQINLYKDLKLTNTGGSGGGTTVIKFLGTEDQTITTAGIGEQQSRLPSIIFEKPSGKVVFPSLITVYGNWNYVSGELDVNTNNSTIVFNGRLSLKGNPIQLNNVTFFGDNASDFTLDPGLLTVNGTLRFAGTLGAPSIQSTVSGSVVIDAKGDVIVASTTSSGGGGNGKIRLSGTGHQTFSGNATAGTGNLPAIIIDKSAGTLTLQNTISLYNSWTHIRGTVDPSNSTVAFNLNPITVTSNSMSFYNIQVNSGGVFFADDAVTMGNFTINGGTVNCGNHIMTVHGNWSSSASNRFSHDFGTVVLAGSAPQSISCTGGEKFYNLTVSGSGTKNLLSNVNVYGELKFVSGIISTGSNKLIMQGTATVAGAGSGNYVYGNLQKSFSNGSNVARNFEVGNAMNYTPVSLTFPLVSTAGEITISSKDGNHPQLTISGLDTLKSIANYWTISNSQVAPSSYNASFSFTAAEVQAGTSINNLVAGAFTGGVWQSRTISSRSSTSISVNSLSSFGDFQFAERATSSITIQSNVEGEICYGTSVTFTASTEYPGPNPVYQWKVNGATVGANSPAFSTATLMGAVTVSCTLTSSLPLANGNPTSSNEISFTVSSGVWIGLEDSNWNNPNNWCGGIPTAGTDIVLNAGLGNYPVISGSAVCQNITIDSGAVLNIDLGTLEISGHLVNNGTINSLGTIAFTANGNQTLSGTGTNNFPEVAFRGGGEKMLSAPLLVSSLVTLGDNTVLNANGNLTLLATASTNASIGPLKNGAAVSGYVNVRAHFTGGDSKYRGTRVMSSPIIDSELPGNNTYKQLQGSMIITGPGGVTKGFDAGGRFGPEGATLLTYNEPATLSQSQFTPVANIHETISPGKAFFLYYRGDRSNYSSKVNAPYAVPESVTMTYSGPINQGDVKVNLSYTDNPSEVAYNGYNLIGNPYPAVVDWTRVSKLNVGEEMKFIRPSGGFATFTGEHSTNAFGEDLRYIQPGQGFYVRAAGPGASVTFTEDAKAPSFTPAKLLYHKESKLSLATGQGAAKTASLAKKEFRLNLQDGLNKEEALVVFKNGKTAKASSEDATFFGGSTISLSTLSSDSIRLAINFMPEPDSVFELGLYVDGTSVNNLKLNFTDFSAVQNHNVFLRDNYLNRLVDAKSEPSYNFSINKSIPGSFGNKRFSVLLVPQTTLPLNLLSLKAQVANEGALLTWRISGQSYSHFEIERAANGLDFEKIGEVTSAAAQTRFSFTDLKPLVGYNYYRIRQVENDGKAAYSSLVQLKFLVGNAAIKAYPNPTADKLYIELQRTSSLTLSVTGLDGRVLKSRIVRVNQPLEESMKDLIPGTYILQLINTDTSELLGTVKFIKK